jgi:hypothetical protein
MNDEIFLARTSALHDILTAWIAGIQEQTNDELTRFMARDPAELANVLLAHLTSNVDSRMRTMTLTRKTR